MGTTGCGGFYFNYGEFRRIVMAFTASVGVYRTYQ